MERTGLPCQIDVKCVLPVGSVEIHPAIRFTDFPDRRIESAVDFYASHPMRMIPTGDALMQAEDERRRLYQFAVTWLRKAIQECVHASLLGPHPEAVYWEMRDGSFRVVQSGEYRPLARYLDRVTKFRLELTRYVYNGREATPCLFYSCEF
ncbi:MAG: hypothetical protein KBC38_01405 [Candidatus Pacebacteria bacterium]|nr:hypothetical protein [Candidatus Paceibacterota bacterium]MBP9840292.1 hypothetical protein [Candidatus Paceibacterota bacterium]